MLATVSGARAWIVPRGGQVVGGQVVYCVEADDGSCDLDLFVRLGPVSSVPIIIEFPAEIVEIVERPPLYIDE